MWQFVANLIAGPFLKAATDAYAAKLKAGNDQDRIVADLVSREAALQQKEAEVAGQLLVAEQRHFLTRNVRPAWALPFILFTWKVVVWDKVLGLGTTDPLDPKMWGVFMLMVGCYFGGRSIEKATSVIADAIKRR